MIKIQTGSSNHCSQKLHTSSTEICAPDKEEFCPLVPVRESFDDYDHTILHIGTITLQHKQQRPLLSEPFYILHCSQQKIILLYCTKIMREPQFTVLGDGRWVRGDGGWEMENRRWVTGEGICEMGTGKGIREKERRDEREETVRGDGRRETGDGRWEIKSTCEQMHTVWVLWYKNRWLISA